VDLETFIIAVFCLVDDGLKAATAGRRIRARGPAPVLADSEVLAIEVVGEFLGLDRDRAIYDHFRRHHAALFPALPRAHRTTFARQAAGLWPWKARLWRVFLDRIPHDPRINLVDSFPVPVCRFARAHRCRLFRGEASFGHDELVRGTYYGFRCHVRVWWPGIIAAFSLAPANESDLAVLPELAEGAWGWAVGDRNYWSPRLAEDLAAGGLVLLAPYRSAKHDPDPARSAGLSRIRYRAETTCGQLVERYDAKRVRARDLWHLGSRLLRKVLGHTVAVVLNVQSGNEPLQLARLLA
jgi:Transposase DDE domain